MSFQPAGDTLIIEKELSSESIYLPDTLELSEQDIFIVKAVGSGYVTEQGQVIPPEPKIGDRVIVKGKILRITIKGSEMLLCRAQDVVAFERGGK